MASLWGSTEYSVYNRSYLTEHAEIFGMIRDEGITGLAIVAGDKHSFWAGYPSENLPPRKFEPVGVEFITGSISQQGSAEVQLLTFPKDNPLRPLDVALALAHSGHQVRTTVARCRTGIPSMTWGSPFSLARVASK